MVMELTPVITIRLPLPPDAAPADCPTQAAVAVDVKAGEIPEMIAFPSVSVAAPDQTFAVWPEAVFAQVVVPVVAPHEYRVATPPDVDGIVRYPPSVVSAADTQLLLEQV